MIITFLSIYNCWFFINYYWKNKRYFFFFYCVAKRFFFFPGISIFCFSFGAFFFFFTLEREKYYPRIFFYDIVRCLCWAYWSMVWFCLWWWAGWWWRGKRSIHRSLRLWMKYSSLSQSLSVCLSLSLILWYRGVVGMFVCVCMCL